jgi:hypothetical protein
MATTPYLIIYYHHFTIPRSRINYLLCGILYLVEPGRRARQVIYLSIPLYPACPGCYGRGVFCAMRYMPLPKPLPLLSAGVDFLDLTGHI